MPTGTPENSSNPENGNLQAEIMATFQEKNEEIEALKLRVEAEKQRQEEKEEELKVMRQRLQALQQEHITQQQEIQEQQLQIQQHQHHEQQRQQRQTLQQQQQREFLPPPPPPPMPQHTLQRSVTAPAESHIRQLSNIKLEKFDGKTSAVQWWMKFMAFISLQKLSEQTAILHLPFFLIGAAETWFNSLDTIKKLTLNSIHEAFINRFKPPSNHVFDLLELQQGPTESVEEFIHRVTEKATDLKMDTNQTMGKIMRGLKPKIKADMVKVNPTNMEDLRTHAMLAEMAQSICSDDAVQSATGAAMCNALTYLEQRMSALETSNINVLQETRRFNSPAKQKPYFSNNQNQSQRGPQRHGYREADQQKNMGSRPRQSQQCFRCGESCDSFYNCRARNQKCIYCNRYNHIWKCCRTLEDDLKKGKIGQTDIQALTTQSTNNSA